MLFDQGVLARNGVVSIVKPLTSIQIPATVKGILAARIDKLASADKELLQSLAVIGKEFPMGLVRRVVGKTDDELTPMLSNLQTAEFIYEQPAFPENEYTFKHALTQEVAYDSVLMERRRSIHERTAAAVEATFADTLDDHLAGLAHHYSRSGNAPKAIEYLTRAADQARMRSAYNDAIGYAREALTLIATMPESRERDQEELKVLMLLTPLIVTTQGFSAQEMTRSLERAQEICRCSGETPEMFGVMFQLWSFDRFHQATARESRGRGRLADVGRQTSRRPRIRWRARRDGCVDDVDGRNFGVCRTSRDCHHHPRARHFALSTDAAGAAHSNHK